MTDQIKAIGDAGATAAEKMVAASDGATVTMRITGGAGGHELLFQ